MNEKLFQYRDYTAFLRDLIESQREVRGYQAKLAVAAQTHSSYFSRVVNGAVHLTSDQAAHLAQFLGMTSDQTDYFLGLVALERAASPTLKKVMERQLADLRKKGQEISQRLPSAKKLSESEPSIYYSAWYYSAVHMLLMVPKYQSLPAIAQRLGISERLVQNAIEVLVALKVVEEKGGRWKVSEADLHMPQQYAWTPMFHANWRQRFAGRVFEYGEEDVHFTGLHAMSRKDFESVKELLRDAIEKIRSVAAP